MSAPILTSRNLGARLQELGFIPPHCRLMELRVTPDGALVIHYEVFVDAAQLASIGQAMIEAADFATSQGKPMKAESA